VRRHGRAGYYAVQSLAAPGHVKHAGLATDRKDGLWSHYALRPAQTNWPRPISRSCGVAWPTGPMPPRCSRRCQRWLDAKSQAWLAPKPPPVRPRLDRAGSDGQGEGAPPAQPAGAEAALLLVGLAAWWLVYRNLERSPLVGPRPSLDAADSRLTSALEFFVYEAPKVLMLLFGGGLRRGHRALFLHARAHSADACGPKTDGWQRPWRRCWAW